MTHQDIELNEVIERYVLNKLSPDERRAFQEHFFECDECFEQAKVSTRFIAGVRAESASGVFAPNRRQDKSGSSFWQVLRPAFALSVATSLMLAIALAWLWFSQVPGLREEIARQRQAREEIELETRTSREEANEQLENGRRQLESERAKRAELEGRLEGIARNNPGPGPATGASPQANTPIVTLESARDSGTANQVTVPSEAQSVLLWIAVEQGHRFESFRVQILTKQGLLVETLTGAKPNQYGALTVSVPANRFQAGQYVVKLYGARGQQSELHGEYDLRVVRK